jgi:hypothetical protein
MKKDDKRIRVTKEVDIDLKKNPDIVTMIDEMRNKETIDGISRPSMVRIAVVEAYIKRNPKK